MNSRMALLTDRLDIEPVFWLIVPMMVLYGLFTALALNGCWMRKISPHDNVIDGRSCVLPFRIPATISYLGAPINFFSFWRFSISHMIEIHTEFTTRLIPILFCLVFVKFCGRFGFIALGTSLCYNILRHGLFSKKIVFRAISKNLSCLWPIYSTRDNESCQRKIGGNLCRYTP